MWRYHLCKGPGTSEVACTIQSQWGRFATCRASWHAADGQAAGEKMETDLGNVNELVGFLQGATHGLGQPGRNKRLYRKRSVPKLAAIVTLHFHAVLCQPEVVRQARQVAATHSPTHISRQQPAFLIKA